MEGFYFLIVITKPRNRKDDEDEETNLHYRPGSLLSSQYFPLV